MTKIKALRLNTHTALSDDTVTDILLNTIFWTVPQLDNFTLGKSGHFSPRILGESVCAFDSLMGSGP